MIKDELIMGQGLSKYLSNFKCNLDEILFYYIIFLFVVLDFLLVCENVIFQKLYEILIMFSCWMIILVMDFIFYQVFINDFYIDFNEIN